MDGMILAPAEFGQILGERLLAYSLSLPIRRINMVKFAIIHKGRLHDLSKQTLKLIHHRMRPVFANEVFVVFSANPNLPALNEASPHLKAYWERFYELYPPLIRRLKQRIISILINTFVRELQPVIREAVTAALRAEFHREESRQLLTTEIHNFISEAIPAELRSFRPVVYLGDHLALTCTIFGHKMVVNTQDLSLSYHILLDGFWELWVTKIIQEVVKPGWTIVEVGANMGYYSLLMASLVGSTGRVYAFEPNPMVYKLLKLNLEINGFLDRAIAIPKAVFDRSCCIEFGVALKHMGNSGVFTFGTFDEPAKRISVEAVALDDFFAQNKKINLIKIDAEGSEFFVLKGAQRVIAENPELIIIMEFVPKKKNIIGFDPGEALAQLTDRGFHIYRINEDGSLRKVSVNEIMNIPYSELYLSRVQRI